LLGPGDDAIPAEIRTHGSVQFAVLGAAVGADFTGRLDIATITFLISVYQSVTAKLSALTFVKGAHVRALHCALVTGLGDLADIAVLVLAENAITADIRLVVTHATRSQNKPAQTDSNQNYN